MMITPSCTCSEEEHEPVLNDVNKFRLPYMVHPQLCSTDIIPNACYIATFTHDNRDTICNIPYVQLKNS